MPYIRRQKLGERGEHYKQSGQAAEVRYTAARPRISAVLHRGRLGAVWRVVFELAFIKAELENVTPILLAFGTICIISLR